MFTPTLSEQLPQLAAALKTAQHAYALTGAGISTPAGIPDLEHLARQSAHDLSSEQTLIETPDKFYAEFHQLFIDPIDHHGPTISHRVLAQLEDQGQLAGVITTNVDYLHELAGSHHVADIWGSLNVNYCLDCGRVYPLASLRAAHPTCPVCGGLLSPEPIHHHIGINPTEYAKANAWMATADLVLTIGSNGYYDNIPASATVININPQRNAFDHRADLTLRATADQVFSQLPNVL